MEKKKNYSKPEIYFETLTMEDVIRTSGEVDDKFEEDFFNMFKF